MRRRHRPVYPGLLFALAVSIGFAADSPAQSISMDEAMARLQVTDRHRDGPKKSRLVLYTTMATWCVPCKVELPQFSYLRSVFKPEELDMIGLPYDDKEGAKRLEEWAAANRPAYELLAGLPKDKISSVKAMVIKRLRMDAVPASIVTDIDGNILRVKFGPPSVSELREMLRSQGDRK